MQSITSAPFARSITCLAGLRVAGEHDAALGGVQAVGQRVEPGLHVNGGRGGHLPAVPSRCTSPGPTSWVPTVGGIRGSVPPRLTYTCWLVGALTRAIQSWANAPTSSSRMRRVNSVVGGGPKTCSSFALPGRLVPAAQQEARVVHVVVKVVVREEEIVDLRRPEPGLDQLVGGGRAAVEHQVLAGHVHHVRRAEPLGRRRRGAGPEDVDAHDQ